MKVTYIKAWNIGGNTSLRGKMAMLALNLRYQGNIQVDSKASELETEADGQRRVWATDQLGRYVENCETHQSQQKFIAKQKQ